MTAAELIHGCAPHRHRAFVSVDVNDSADRWGNAGLLVLSTPAMLGHVENVCVAWLEHCLPPDAMTVGVSVQLDHLAPSPVPAEIEISIDLAGTERSFFDVAFTVSWAGQTVGRGAHRRAVVDRSRFMSRIAVRAGSGLRESSEDAP